ncbi:MAG: NAD(P)/FAD-dependent oxidoreductase [Desulfobacterota bacterium]|nr:NAD(P)/FAD-dependent oxidoreductase [Thermodesulfobacteriota bacterium]
MEKVYDVIVAGAGPAGLITALTAGTAGLRVLLIDMKRDIPRVFRACCCNLIIEPGTHGETVTHTPGSIRFEKNRFAVPYSGAVIPLKKSYKVSPLGNTLKINGKSRDGNVAISYEKEVLLNDLFQRVQGNRMIEIRTETQALAVENLRSGVRVTIRTDSSLYHVRGRIAVAADGVNSKLVQSLGLNQTRRKFFARFRVASYHMEGVDCPYPDAWITFVGTGHTRGRRGQLYMCPKPHGGTIEPRVYELTIGIPVVAAAPGFTPQEELRYFTTEGRFAPWFRHMKIIDTRAATLNFYTPLTNPVEGNVVVVGDAAAFIETYVQGALMYGYQAGNAIVKHLATGTGLEEYAASWAKTFEYNDPEEIKKATQGFGLHVLRDEDIDYLFSLTKGDEVYGYVNEFSDPITVRRTLLSHLDQVRRERPQLAAQLEKFAEVSVHDALQVK